jgi:hypothetical protein
MTADSESRLGLVLFAFILRKTFLTRSFSCLNVSGAGPVRMAAVNLQDSVGDLRTPGILGVM